MADKIDFKSLVGKKLTKSITFMGQKVDIKKLSVAEVMEIQAKAKDAEKDEKENFNILKLVIRSAVEGTEDVEDSDFDKFPLDELTNLANEIMKYSGIRGDDAGK